MGLRSQERSFVESEDEQEQRDNLELQTRGQEDDLDEAKERPQRLKAS